MLSVVVFLAGAVTIALALVWVLQRRMIYFPLPQDVPHAASALERAEDVTFETADGLRLHGWFASPAQSNGATVLIFNGNAGDRSSRAPLAAALTRNGFSVLLFDYRGYGGNPGQPTEPGLVADARAARQYVGSRADVDRARLVYFGEPLGAAVAVALAVEQPPSSPGPAVAVHLSGRYGPSAVPIPANVPLARPLREPQPDQPRGLSAAGYYG